MHTPTSSGAPKTRARTHTRLISNNYCVSTATVIRERASMSRYTYIACLVPHFPNNLFYSKSTCNEETSINPLKIIKFHVTHFYPHLSYYISTPTFLQLPLQFGVTSSGQGCPTILGTMPKPLLWTGSWATGVKSRLSGIPNLNYCVICIVYVRFTNVAAGRITQPGGPRVEHPHLL
jgi:hypothetical protein